MAHVTGAHSMRTVDAREVHEVATEHSDDVILFKLIITDWTVQSRRVHDIAFVTHIHGIIVIAKFTQIIIIRVGVGVERTKAIIVKRTKAEAAKKRHVNGSWHVADITERVDKVVHHLSRFFFIG